MKDHIGVTGPKGRLGSALVDMGCDPIHVDINSQDDLQEHFKSNHYDAVINCAAFANPVDACEDDMKKAVNVNLRGPYYLRQSYEGYLIHISTSYVFDGINGPYYEYYPNKNPLQAYGFTKWGGEMAVQSFTNKCTTVVRTVGLFGSKKYDFVDQVRSVLMAGLQFQAAYDLSFNPTYVYHLAEALIALVGMGKSKYEYIPILNLASTDTSLSRKEFAVMVAKEWGLNKDLIVPVSYKDLSWKSDRPRFAGLIVDYAKTLGLPLYSAQEGLEAYHRSLDADAKV